MVITASQTVQTPQAPSPPVVAQQALSKLINYYRELAQYHRSSVDYHRQLLEQHSHDAEVAEKQLASIEAILHPLTTESVNKEISNNPNDKQVNGTGIITPLEDKSDLLHSAQGCSSVTTVKPEEQVEQITTNVEKSEPEALTSVTQSSPKKNSKTKSTSSKDARTSQSRERRASLRSSSNDDWDAIASASRPLSSKTKKPTKKKNTRKTKKSTKAFSARLPYSEKLAPCKTIVDAVALCLQEYYPQVISAEDIVKYYYPEGLEGETNKRAYGAFSNCLSKGAGKQGWIKASIGKYRWKDEG